MNSANQTIRFFNTAGPVNKTSHYCLNPLERFDFDEILSLINQQKYFVIHAPRQSGKTTCLLALSEYLNSTGNYRCLYFNVETAQAAGDNVKQAMKAILTEMAFRAFHYLNDDFIKNNWQRIIENNGEYAAINEILSCWAGDKKTPLVLLIDEIDSLIGDTLISVLRQLRSGYDKRPLLFPQSVILCGVRDVRDYRIHSSKEKSIITGGSAFNIKAESFRIGDFSESEISKLYFQHTEETGQKFDNKLIPYIWELTEGQPWLVNALAYEACFKIKEGKERKNPISLNMIDQAKENIVLKRDSHIDQLADKLKEERVRKVIQPILLGQEKPEHLIDDDIWYAEDLGLIKTQGNIRIANRIYQEIIPRSLTYSAQLTIHQESGWYVNKNDGCIDIDKLLSSFQIFFRENSEHWIERFEYKEAGPQLLLQAYLQRIVNGGGRIEREYGLGRTRTDLLVIWPCNKTLQKIVIELKLRYGSLENTIEKGLEQTWLYMDKCGTSDGHLMVFDRDKRKSWEEKIFVRKENYKNRTIKIWGL